MEVTIKNNVRPHGDTFDIRPLNELVTIPRAAIYTIWTYDSSSEKNPYPLLYVGQSGNLEERLDKSHHKYQCWVSHAISNTLLAGYWLTPSEQYSADKRKQLESDLIAAYKPVCNDKA